MHLDGDRYELTNQVQMECQYPGQTMMVALAIILNFKDLVAANYRSGDCADALASSKVPGAGDAVCNALRELEKGVREDLDAKTMISSLHECWRDYAGHQSAYANRVEAGLRRAEPFENEFAARWNRWKSASKAAMSEPA